MTARLVRGIVFLLVLSVISRPASAIAGQTQLPDATNRPSGPKPSPAVVDLLDEASRLVEDKQPLDSLKAAEQAFGAAQQANDKAGEPFAQQARAKALQDLQRTDEAIAAWQKAAEMWGGIGNAPDQITALVQAGLLCTSSRKEEAEKLFAQALLIGKSDNQPTVALAETLQEAGMAIYQPLRDGGVARNEPKQLQTVWDFLTAALAIREKQTPESLNLLETLNALATVANQRGLASNGDDDHYYTVAKEYSLWAIELGRRLAPDSTAMAKSLHNLAFADVGLTFGETTAIQYFLEALKIERRATPGGSMDEIETLDQLGAIERRQGNFPAALQHASEAVAMGERIAPGSLTLARDLGALGVVETQQGRLAAAHDHLERSLELKEKLRGRLAPTYINLGVVALDESDYAAARDFFERALALFMKDKGKSYGVKVALANLSQTYYRQGDLASAIEYCRRALAISQAIWLNTPDGSYTLQLMGDLLREQGQFSQAADYYQRALDIRQKLAPDSLYVSEILDCFANLARAQHNIGLAMGYERRALELAQKSCPDSWCTATYLNEIGELAYEQGDLISSESYLRRAVVVEEKSLGPMHPDLARSLDNLALTIAAEGRMTEALADALRAERIGAEHLRVSVRTLSERQALAYEAIRASGLDLALTLVTDRQSTVAARSQVFDAVIRSRALVFDELAARHRSAYGGGDPEVASLTVQLFSARSQLATLTFRGADNVKPETYRKLLDDARVSKEEAERMLAEKSIAFRQDQARTQIGLKEVAGSLPQGSALVAFVRYARPSFRTPARGEIVPKSTLSYAAIELRAGRQEPELVRLGSAQVIDGLVTAWRRNIAQQAEVADVRGGANAYRRLGAALRRMIWDPLLPSLGNAREVFVVPDGELHLVNLASLPVGSSQYLIETGPLIHYLSTERDLVPTNYSHGEGILVVGNPAFDQAAKFTVASNKQSAPVIALTAPGRSLRGSRSKCVGFENLRFASLPASQQEAEDITSLWRRSTLQATRGKQTPPAPLSSGQSLELTGADASPEAFQQYAPGKRVLHIATHGFFLQAKCNSLRQTDSNRHEASFLPAAENPSLLSGLAFAGANRRTTAKPDETDGILTAEQIAGINLEGVDWAVLSACDTGLGEIRAGEGVFGLRRAFQVAGAKTVIMSLWRVEDETTRQWMEALYLEHFINGKETAQSVRAASLQILRQHQVKHQSTHPFYWRAFIAVGD